jgi:hypothetical protein
MGNIQSYLSNPSFQPSIIRSIEGESTQNEVSVGLLEEQNVNEIICCKCKDKIKYKEKLKNYVRCRLGHVICVDCFHDCISNVLDKKLPEIVCYADVEPVCISEYDISTFVEHLTLKEYRRFLKIYMDNSILTLSKNSNNTPKKTFFFNRLPFAYPKMWYDLF